MHGMNVLAIALAVAALSGCAAFSTDAARISVTEYAGSGGGVFTSGTAGGCVVEQSESAASAAGKSSMSIALVYRGEKCSVDARSR